MTLNPTDSVRTIKVLNSQLKTTQEEIEEAKASTIVTNRLVKSLDATVNGTIDLDPMGNEIIKTDLDGQPILDNYGIPKYQRQQDGLAFKVGGVKVYYTEEEPTEANSGDLWYHIVDGKSQDIFSYDGESWNEIQLDHTVLVEKCITADEIASHTISADEILGNSLTIGCMDSSVMSSASTNNQGQMEWDNNALRIDSTDGTNYYETEIGGDGIKFRYGSSLDYARSDNGVVAQVNQQYLEINKTIVFSEMQIGNWSWAIAQNGHLIVKWNGGI